MSDAMDNTPAAGSDKKIIIIGIGGNGARIIRSFSHLPGSAVYDTAAIDTDRESLGISGAKSTIQADPTGPSKAGSAAAATQNGRTSHRAGTFQNHPDDHWL